MLCRVQQEMAYEGEMRAYGIYRRSCVSVYAYICECIHNRCSGALDLRAGQPFCLVWLGTLQVGLERLLLSVIYVQYCHDNHDMLILPCHSKWQHLLYVALDPFQILATIALAAVMMMLK